MTEFDLRHVIAIDGPAAVGKTTVSRRVAEMLNVPYFDTGVLYRWLTLVAAQRGIAPGAGEALASVVDDMDVALAADGTLTIDGAPVGTAIRDPEVDARVSEVSAHPAVRAALLPVQRALAARGPIVMTGRDITTVVAPDSELKFFLNATPEERAARRWREVAGRGESMSEAEVLAEIIRRDHADSTRAVAPLRPADDATVIDTTGLTADEVAAEIAGIVRGQALGIAPTERPAQ